MEISKNHFHPSKLNSLVCPVEDYLYRKQSQKPFPIDEGTIKALRTKLTSLRRQKAHYRRLLDNQIEIVELANKDSFSKTFWKIWIENTTAKKLVSIQDQIDRISFITNRTKVHKPYQDLVDHARNTPILELVQQHTEVRKSGSKYFSKCVFHQEENPSLVVYPDTNSFYCFSCQKGGDPISFIQELRKVDFKGAIKYLNSYK